MSNAKGVWVFVEVEREEITKTSLGLICEGKKLSGALGEELCAILTGDGIEQLSLIPPRYGTDKVYTITNCSLSGHDIDSYVSLLARLTKDYSPRMILFGATSLGRELAPRLAARLKVCMVSECVELKIEDGRLIARRPVFGGKAHATVACSPVTPQIATVAPGILEVKEPDNTKTGEIIKITDIKVQSPRVEFISFAKGDPKAISITEADRIVAVGRGLEKTENLPVVQELADVLGASIGGTRVAVDMRWMPLERQIGVTGKTVAPSLFISCGISGQNPHTVGMEGSDTIIVINTDRNAPMFKLATMGMLGDVQQVVPALTKQIKEKLATQEKK